jgi:hypothetical protein
MRLSWGRPPPRFASRPRPSLTPPPSLGPLPPPRLGPPPPPSLGPPPPPSLGPTTPPRLGPMTHSGPEGLPGGTAPSTGASPHPPNAHKKPSPKGGFFPGKAGLQTKRDRAAQRFRVGLGRFGASRRLAYPETPSLSRKAQRALRVGPFPKGTRPAARQTCLPCAGRHVPN